MYWLLFNTRLCHWIVNVCCLKTCYNDTNKKRTYNIEFDYYNRYTIEITKLLETNKSNITKLMGKTNNNTFRCNLLKDGKQLCSIMFNNPNDLCHKLFNHKNLNVQRFVRLLLNHCQFTLVPLS